MDLYSALPRSECVARLKPLVGSEWTILGKLPVVGRVRDTSLRLRKRIFYRNSFQTLLFGTLEERDGGTIIHCRFGLHPFVAWFLAIWFGGIVIIGSSTIVTAISRMIRSEASPTSGIGVYLLAPVLMIAFGFALFRFGRYLARGERQYLEDFLRDALEARRL